MDLQKLKTPFPAKDIEWRISRSGAKNGKPWAGCLAYVTARAIHDRLDEVCGPENWSMTFREMSYEHDFQYDPKDKTKLTRVLVSGIICDLKINVPGLGWITKSNGAQPTDFEPFKGAISDAEKRAAVEAGIGRYLYNLTEAWAQFEDSNGQPFTRSNGKYLNIKGTVYYWNPPLLPAWALPGTAKPATATVTQPEATNTTPAAATATQDAPATTTTTPKVKYAMKSQRDELNSLIKAAKLKSASVKAVAVTAFNKQIKDFTYGDMELIIQNFNQFKHSVTEYEASTGDQAA